VRASREERAVSSDRPRAAPASSVVRDDRFDPARGPFELFRKAVERPEAFGRQPLVPLPPPRSRRLVDERRHLANASVRPARGLGELAGKAPGLLEKAAQLGGRLLEGGPGIPRAGRQERDVQAEEIRPVGEACEGRGEREEGVGGARELRQAARQAPVERGDPLEGGT
jgi:hypothetical protein